MINPFRCTYIYSERERKKTTTIGTERMNVEDMREEEKEKNQ